MIKLKTDFPVALDSMDHQHPSGTMKDNSKWHPFNEKIYWLYRQKQVSVLDIGCAGGGMIEDFVNDGHIGVGLEGSDYSLKHQRASWKTIPHHLFTCDCRKPFQLLFGNENMKFDIITAWEVMEHFAEKELDGVFANIINHLDDGGLLMVSIPAFEDGPRHRIVKNKRWWREKLKEYNFYEDESATKHIDKDFVRGYRDWQGHPVPNGAGRLIGAFAHHE